ncbi:DUF2778 domain-containing protein [Dickeya dadantii]|uniref:DUF2778 domain-containing protein n=1 Tax=Dickeya dadantii TaxID=204038 RepID=UPI0021DB7EDA|nr:DUF2778 domain-containing protein [Dickeya dadantii]
MALHGKFIVNDANFSPLSFPGFGTYLAFSGNNQYRNHSGCTAIPNNGPIPAGKYWIVDRPTAGLRSKTITFFKDIASGIKHAEWFALYQDDGIIDDYAWVNGVKRGNFRLHPRGRGGISEGCITLQHITDFYALRNFLLHTTMIKIPRTNLSAYGTIEVIANGKICSVSD